MSQKTIILMPKMSAILRELGENLRLARLRRNVTAKLEAERAGVSLATLKKIEAGLPSVALGNYAQVLQTFGMEKELLNIARDDELGRKLQDLKLATRKRASKRGLS